jgi:hypothetical protein
MAGSDTFELEVYDDELGRYVRVPDPSAKSLSVRKDSPKATQKRRFEAKRAERLRANEAATTNVGKLGSGIASIPGRVVNYIKSSSPSSVARDVKGIAKATYDAAVEDPNAFAEDAIFSPLAAIRDFGDVRETARKLRAQGRDAEAEKMEAMAGTAILSAVPILGRPAGVATRKAIKAAEKTATKGATKAPAIIKKASGAEKRAPSRAAYSREELAVRYPETTPPVTKIDKRTGKEFLSKSESPEAAALAAERARVAAEMKDEGYTPFFNPEERYYADPTGYQLEGNTLDIRPAREDTIAKYEVMANDPEAMDRLRQAYALGSEYPGAEKWYAMGQLEDAYKRGLGDEEGRAMFKERFADAMAATTGGMDPDANLRLAQFMNFQREQGNPTPLASFELPYPIGGGKYGVMPNVAQYEAIINRGAGLSTANPKRFNFSSNFLGDVNRATLDEQMMSGGWDPKLQMPPSNTYGIYEGALGRLAKELGVAPAEAQDVMWAGIKLPKDASYTPKPMIQIVNDAIERTARLTGQSPDEVVEQVLVKAKRPMYAQGGMAQLADKYGC